MKMSVSLPGWRWLLEGTYRAADFGGGMSSFGTAVPVSRAINGSIKLRYL